MCSRPLIIALCTVFLAAAAFAAPPAGGPAVDPETDTTLLTIKAALVPSRQQMTKIIELYVKLREDQHKVMSEIHEAHRPAPPAGGDGGNVVPAAPSAAERDAIVKETQEKIKPLNDEFLKQCAAILEPSQQEMWNTLTGAINLMPKPLRKGGDGLNPDKGPKVGELAPSFSLQDVDGGTVSLDSLRGRPVVLEFGSYTCPIFRNKTDMIETMRQEFGDSVQWVLIYVMEAHPTDGWVVPINTHEGIELPQHTSIEKRIECANLARAKLNLNVHVLVDSFDNAITKAYSGAPNRAYVLDADGKIVSKQLWADPEKIRAALKDLAAKSG